MERKQANSLARRNSYDFHLQISLDKPNHKEKYVVNGRDSFCGSKLERVIRIFVLTFLELDMPTDYGVDNFCTQDLVLGNGHDVL